MWLENTSGSLTDHQNIVRTLHFWLSGSTICTSLWMKASAKWINCTILSTMWSGFLFISSYSYSYQDMESWIYSNLRSSFLSDWDARQLEMVITRAWGCMSWTRNTSRKLGTHKQLAGPCCSPHQCFKRINTILLMTICQHNTTGHTIGY